MVGNNGRFLPGRFITLGLLSIHLSASVEVTLFSELDYTNRNGNVNIWKEREFNLNRCYGLQGFRTELEKNIFPPLYYLSLLRIIRLNLLCA